MEMPLLPLHTVLFPQMALRLRITERLHLEAMQRCADSDRVFGVVLARSASDRGGIDPYRVGTSAYILDLTAEPGGKGSVVVIGQQRFRVLEFEPGEFFASGRFEWYPESDEDASEPASAVGQLLQRYLECLLERVASLRLSLSGSEIPQDPEELSYTVAALLPIALSEKQRLLELPGPAARLTAEVPLLQRQIEQARHGAAGARAVRSLGAADMEWLAKWRN